MANVFISYSKADAVWARRVADALAARGFTAWWDTEGLSAGGEFAAEIERELDAADAVLVLWSQTSARSEWVRDEADHGKRHGKLVSAIIDALPLPPLGFRQRHAVHINTWPGDPNGPEFAAVLEAVAALSGRAPPQPVAAPVAPAPQTFQQAPPPARFRFGFFLPPLLALAIAAFAVIQIDSIWGLSPSTFADSAFFFVGDAYAQAAAPPEAVAEPTPGPAPNYAKERVEYAPPPQNPVKTDIFIVSTWLVALISAGAIFACFFRRRAATLILGGALSLCVGPMIFDGMDLAPQTQRLAFFVGDAYAQQGIAPSDATPPAAPAAEAAYAPAQQEEPPPVSPLAVFFGAVAAALGLLLVAFWRRGADGAWWTLGGIYAAALIFEVAQWGAHGIRYYSGFFGTEVTPIPYLVLNLSPAFACVVLAYFVRREDAAG